MAFEIKKVIIKGTLPESCGQCWLEEDPDPYPCYCVFDYSRKLVTDWKSRPNWCPLTTKNETIEKIVKVLTNAGLGISAHFCDWNRPSQWQNRPTPDEVEKWVVDKIRESDN